MTFSQKLLLISVPSKQQDWEGSGENLWGVEHMHGAAGGRETKMRLHEQFSKVRCSSTISMPGHLQGQGKNMRPKASPHRPVQSIFPKPQGLASYLGWAWGIPGLVSFFIQQRPHHARAAVGEGLEAFLAVVGPHAAVP